MSDVEHAEEEVKVSADAEQHNEVATERAEEQVKIDEDAKRHDVVATEHAEEEVKIDEDSERHDGAASMNEPTVGPNTTKEAEAEQPSLTEENELSQEREEKPDVKETATPVDVDPSATENATDDVPSQEDRLEEELAPTAIDGPANELVEEEAMPLSQENDATSDKGKAKETQVDERAETPKDEVKSNVSSDSGKSSPVVLPQNRYMLPIGGPARRKRPITTKRSSSLINGAGPSTPRRAQGKQSPSSLSSSSKRPAPVRRLSSSDIPAKEEDEVLEDGVLGDIGARRRSQTLSERGQKGKTVKDRLRPVTAPAESDSKVSASNVRGQLHRRKTSSSMMVDGQMFFIDDEESIKEKKAKSTTAESASDAGKPNPGGRARLLSKAADLGDMAFLARAMRRPVKAQDEPMIYDADELDDIPPPGSYAIHPPSKGRLAEAAALSLFDEDGNMVRFGSIFERQRTLIIFLRHWLCPFCQMFAQSIRNIDPLPLQRADLGLVVVGQGHAHVTKSYKAVMKIPEYVRIFADPSRKIYHALGMTLRTNDAGPACARPEYQTMGVMKASFKAVKHGLVDMPIRLPIDTKLLGGEFILGPGLDCSFTHRMVTVRGHLDLPRVLQQAGCDLTLKTPKDVLNDGETASARVESVRSVDGLTARRFARRVVRKARSSTPREILLSKTRRAAQTASHRGSRPTTRNPLATTFVGKRPTGSVDDQAIEGVKRTRSGTGSTLRSVDSSLLVISSPILSNFDDRSTGLRARRPLSAGTQPDRLLTDLPVRTNSGRIRPATADAIHDRSFARLQAQRPLTSTSVSSFSGWTDDLSRYPGAPPLPRTSSKDAYDAARSRQGFTSEDTEELHSDDGGHGSNVRELQKRFSHRTNLSTTSLGRQHSYATQYHREQARRQFELQHIVNRNTFSATDVRRQMTTDYAKQVNDPNGLPLSQHQRSPSTQSLPQNALFAALPSSNKPATGSENWTTSRRSQQGVPLSVFERRIQHDSSSSSDGTQASSRLNAVRDSLPVSVSSPMSVSFGEDTDYKRLPRSDSLTSRHSTQQQHQRQQRASTGAQSLTSSTVNADDENKTPKARIISLHADELSAPPSARTSQLPPPRSVVDEEAADRERDTIDSPPPPPVPPKSPPKATSALYAPPTRPYAPPATLANRTLMPAPTPAFAAILAAEEARLRKLEGAAAVNNVQKAEEKAEEKVEDGEEEEEENDDKAAFVDASSEPVATPISAPMVLNTSNGSSGSASSGGVPALLAGLPSFTPRMTASSATPLATKEAPSARSTQVQPSTTLPSSVNGPPAKPIVSNVPKTLTPTESNAVRSADEGFFLDDLETVDGFRRVLDRNSSSVDSTLGKTHITAPSPSVGEDDEDEDEDEDYGNDWGPLHARQNLRRSGGIKTTTTTTTGNGRHAPKDGSFEEYEDDEDEDDVSTENDTDESEPNQSAPAPGLALLDVLSKGAKKLTAPSSAVVKRVTSRPGDDGDGANKGTGAFRSTLSGTLNGSARAIRINRLIRKPQQQTAQSPPLTATGRRLTSFAEEEEEEGQDGNEQSDKVQDNRPLASPGAGTIEQSA